MNQLNSLMTVTPINLFPSQFNSYNTCSLIACNVKNLLPLIINLFFFALKITIGNSMSWAESSGLDFSLQFPLRACPFYFSEMRDYSTTDEGCRWSKDWLNSRTAVYSMCGGPKFVVVTEGE